MAATMEEKTALFWIKLLSQPRNAEMCMYDGSTLECTIHEINGDLSLLNVSNVMTPIGLYDQAQIRIQDIRHIRITG
jgi:hypothetical protein